MKTVRAVVSFSNKDLKVYGNSMHKAIGDYDPETGILWNPKAHGGVQPKNPAMGPFGVHMASGNLIQFLPDGYEERQAQPQAGPPATPGPALPVETDDSVNEEAAARLQAAGGDDSVALPEPPKQAQAPVTEAGKRAAAERAAKVAKDAAK